MPITPEKYKSQSGPSFYTMASLPDFVLPGYGLIVAGEKRKGVLFLVAHALNLSILGLIVFSQSLSQSLSWFSKTYNLQINQALTKSLSELTLGSPDAFIALTIFVAFALFAARDAYEYKLKLRRQALYRDHVLPMPEAVSSSYIFHIVFLLVCMALAFFFLIPLAPPRQITDIEFVQAEENTHERPVTKKLSVNNARAAGVAKKLPAREAAHKEAAQKAQAQAQAKSQSAPTAAPAASVQAATKAKTTPPPVPAPTPIPTPIPTPNTAHASAPMPVPTPLSKALPKPTSILTPPAPTELSQALPKPLMPPTLTQLALAPANAPSPLHLPLTAPTSSTVGSVSGVPRPHAQSAAGSQSTQPTPAPVSVLAGTSSSKGNDNTPVQPAKIGKGNSSERGDTGIATNGPAPKRGTSTGTSGRTGLLPGPVLGPSTGTQAPGKTTDGSQNSGPTPGNSPDANLEPDWPPYMADLQRRIKRAWFPSKVGESKRVKVSFTVQRNGEMTNLRLLQSSGLQVVDAAALKAVETAAPFRQLPTGAPKSVDIEFTFDYNVFNGSLR